MTPRSRSKRAAFGRNTTINNFRLPSLLVEGWDEYGFFNALLKRHPCLKHVHIAVCEGKNNLTNALKAISTKLETNSSSLGGARGKVLITGDGDQDPAKAQADLRNQANEFCQAFSGLTIDFEIIGHPETKCGHLNSLLWAAMVELDCGRGKSRHELIECFLDEMKQRGPGRPPKGVDPDKIRTAVWLSAATDTQGRVQNLQHCQGDSYVTVDALLKTQTLAPLVKQRKDFFCSTSVPNPD
jgi:hypothetical protein